MTENFGSGVPIVGDLEAMDALLRPSALKGQTKDGRMEDEWDSRGRQRAGAQYRKESGARSPEGDVGPTSPTRHREQPPPSPALAFLSGQFPRSADFFLPSDQFRGLQVSHGSQEGLFLTPVRARLIIKILF